MTVIKVQVSEMRRAYNNNKATGTVDNPGFTFDGNPVASVEFERAMVIRYYSTYGEIIAVFQDYTFLDD